MFELSHDYEVWDMIENMRHTGKDGTASVGDVLDFEQDEKIHRLLDERANRADPDWWAKQQELFLKNFPHAGLD